MSRTGAEGLGVGILMISFITAVMDDAMAGGGSAAPKEDVVWDTIAKYAYGVDALSDTGVTTEPAIFEATDPAVVDPLTIVQP